MSDVWAYCETCARWFYCPEREPDCARNCPACAAPARTLREDDALEGDAPLAG